MEARQRVELTGTNRPRTWLSLALAIAVPELCSRDAPSTASGRQRSRDTVSVAIAEGKHPVPSRTRKLSPPAPMVLPGRLGGRVGRRRNIFERAAFGRPVLVRPVGSESRWPKTLQSPSDGERPQRPRARPTLELPERRARRGASDGPARPISGRRSLALGRAIELLERGDTGAAIKEAEKAKRFAVAVGLGARGARAGAVRRRAMAGGAHGAEGLPPDLRPRRSEPHHRGLPAGTGPARPRPCRSPRRRSAARRRTRRRPRR